MEREFKITKRDGTFRVAIKNGIEALAMRHYIINMDNGDVENSYNKILEHIEYNIDKDSWIKVKDGNNYYPNGIEQDAQSLLELINYFYSYLYEFFTNSNK
mgnify:CR=1 FL=1